MDMIGASTGGLIYTPAGATYGQMSDIVTKYRRASGEPAPASLVSSHRRPA
jgi:hypothetical protein